MEEIFPIVFATLFVSVILWFYLCKKLFTMLEIHHPAVYEAMGKPSLIMNNTISNNILFMKFLFKREWRELNDMKIAALGKFMLAYAVAYMLALLLIAIAMNFMFAHRV